MKGICIFVVFISVFYLFTDFAFGYVVQNRNQRVGRNEDLTCPEPSGQFNHPQFCDQYLNCWEGKATISQCSHGLVFNQMTTSCDYPAHVDCNGKEDSRPKDQLHSQCRESYHGTFANPSHCGQFIVCQGGAGTPMNCPPGLIYDTELGVCVTPEDPSCLQIAQSDQPNMEDPNMPQLNPDLISPTKPVGPASNPDNGILFPVIPGWPPLKCPIDTSSGRMVPMNCQVLYF